MSAATDVWIDVHSEAFGVSGVVRAGVSHRPRYWATLRTRSERDPPSCVTPHQFPRTDSERNSGVGAQDRQSDPRVEGRGRALGKMGGDDRHRGADGGRLELGDGVLDGAGKGRSEQRDDQQHADERRERSGRVADDQPSPTANRPSTVR